MGKAKVIASETSDIIAAVQSFETAYAISEIEIRDGQRRVDDEAIIEVIAKILMIDQKRKHLVGRPLEVTLLCARSYMRQEPTYDDPIMMGVRFQRERCLASAYLPSEPFWALRSMLARKEVDRIELSSDHPRYGSANLRSLHFGRCQQNRV